MISLFVPSDAVEGAEAVFKVDFFAFFFGAGIIVDGDFDEF